MIAQWKSGTWHSLHVDKLRGSYNYCISIQTMGASCIMRGTVPPFVNNITLS